MAYRDQGKNRLNRGFVTEGQQDMKRVPWREPPKRLRILMLPPRFCTIPAVTQRPSPVPPSPLVVKQGPKMRSRFLGSTPGSPASQRKP